MKIIRNKYLPFRGFSAINLFGVLFVRGNKPVSERTMNHEKIHSAQMRELLYLPFYLLYIIEWLIKLMLYRNLRKAYFEISFEREAYRNDANLNYLKTRAFFAFRKYYRA